MTNRTIGPVDGHTFFIDQTLSIIPLIYTHATFICLTLGLHGISCFTSIRFFLPCGIGLCYNFIKHILLLVFVQVLNRTLLIQEKFVDAAYVINVYLSCLGDVRYRSVPIFVCIEMGLG